jgi:hypothetical protein
MNWKHCGTVTTILEPFHSFFKNSIQTYHVTALSLIGTQEVYVYGHTILIATPFESNTEQSLQK